MPDNQYLDTFRQNAKLITQIRDQLVDYAKSHPDKAQIDAKAEELISQAGGEPAFKRVPGYHWSTCICVNDEFVHGIPKGSINQGDIVTIDLGMYYQKTTTDTAITFVMGKPSPEQKHFLETGLNALDLAIDQVNPSNTVLDITRVIQQTVENAGYNVTRNLVGHGLGETMHEPPQIPCFDSGSPDLHTRLVEGMVLAVEVMYMKGDWPLTKDDDGWTMRTKDGEISGMFEVDVIVTKDKPEIITPITR